MPDLVNKRDHPVRVTDENGQTVRVVPGQVISVEGAVADKLSAYDGVESASDEDREAHAAARGGLPSETVSTKQAMETRYSGLRAQGRAATIAVPLNEVVGDNDAPLGPPSGTITTKQAVMRQGPAERAAFGDHERLPEDAENEGLSDVERAQAEAKALVEDLHTEALDDASESGNESTTSEPPEPEKAPPARKRPKKRNDEAQGAQAPPAP